MIHKPLQLYRKNNYILHSSV
uniref:Uncharacterized protein n=1 Tax=Arundo donax TaxID=35708 RepID=A0A0A9AY38_ARUDO